MSTTKISDLPVLSSADAADEFVVVDDSAGVTKKITQAGLADFGTNAVTTGTLTASGLVTASAGITFGSTTLDDYEEGTWTPDVETGSVTTFNGNYVKTGNLVFLTGNIRTPSNRSSSNAVNVIGLPFTPINNVSSSFDQRPAGIISARRIATVAGYGSWKTCAINSTPAIQFWADGQGGSTDPLLLIHSRFTDPFSGISFTIFYETA